jgi:creatinine amidohydrolase
MAILRLGEMTWHQVRDLDLARVVAVLPIGAIEAHGPHLPLETDVIIAEAMATAGIEALEAAGRTAILLPPLAITSARFARHFPGTLDADPHAVRRQIVAIATSLSRHGLGALALANSHFDPTHLQSLYDAVSAVEKRCPDLVTVFPDVTRRPWAPRLTEEFLTGACHAGCYESSIVLACRPDLVDQQAAAQLPDNPCSLSRAIRDGIDSFDGAGGPDAYFGYPAAATAEEGRQTIATLGRILFDAVSGTLEPPPE